MVCRGRGDKPRLIKNKIKAIYRKRSTLFTQLAVIFTENARLPII